MWNIHSFGKTDDRKVYSDTFWVGGCRWRLVAYPKGSRADDNLSVYVEVLPPLLLGPSPVVDSTDPAWSCLASFSFAIVSQLTGERTICREVTAHRFDRAHTDLGFPHIVRKHLLTDRKSGFVHKDRLTIEFCIRVHDTSYATYPLEANSANFVWRVPNLVAQTASGTRDQRLTSPPFRVSGCNWTLALYPRGKHVNSGAPSAAGGGASSTTSAAGTAGSSSHYLSIYLKATPDAHCSESSWYYLANFRVSLINQVDGTRFSRQVEHRVFRKGVEDWGFPLFMKLSRIFSASSPYTMDGAISIHVDMDILDSHESGGLGVPEPLSTLGWTPLLWAAYHGNIEGVRELLVRLQQQGLEWEQQLDSRGRNALDWAAFGGHTALVQYLCDTAMPNAFTSRDSEGYTPLHKALVNGHWDTVAILLPFYSLFELHSPVSAAKSYRDVESVVETSEPSLGSVAAVTTPNLTSSVLSASPPNAGITISPSPYRDGIESVSPVTRTEVPTPTLHIAARAAVAQSVYPVDIKYWRLLLSYDLSAGGFGAVDAEGRTVVHALAASGALSLLQQLLLDGCITVAELNSVDGGGATPLHLAVQRGHYSLVRWLLASGANPLRGWTAHNGMPASLLSVHLNDIRMLQIILQDSSGEKEHAQPADASLSPSSPSGPPLIESMLSPHHQELELELTSSLSVVDQAANFVSSSADSSHADTRSQGKRKRSNSAAGGDGPFDRFANRHSRIVSRAALTASVSPTAKKGDDDSPVHNAERRRSMQNSDSLLSLPSAEELLHLQETPQPQPSRRRPIPSPTAPQIHSVSPRKDSGDKHARSKSGDYSPEAIVAASVLDEAKPPTLDLADTERRFSNPPPIEVKSLGRKKAVSIVDAAADGPDSEPDPGADSVRESSSSSPVLSHSKRRLSSSSKSTSSGALLSRKRQVTEHDAVLKGPPEAAPPKRSPELLSAEDKPPFKLRKRARSKSSTTSELATLAPPGVDSVPPPMQSKAALHKSKRKSATATTLESSRIFDRSALSLGLAPLAIPASSRSSSPSIDFTTVRKRVAASDLLDAVDDFGNTTMHLAVGSANIPMCLFLLRCGASANLSNDKENTPLDLAIDNDDLRCTISLLENGAQLFGAMSGQRLFDFVSRAVDVAEVDLPPTPSLAADMRFLLNNEAFSDVVLLVEGKRIHAWRGVLCARSEFFRALFLSPLRESVEKDIELTDVPHDIFLRVIEFVYTDSLNDVNLTADSAVSLLSAANRYMLARLKYLVEEWLVARLSDDNVYALFLAADLYEARTLRTKAVQYVAANADRILDLSEVLKNPSFSQCVIDVLKIELSRKSDSGANSGGVSSPPLGSLSPRRASVDSVDNGLPN